MSRRWSSSVRTDGPTGYLTLTHKDGRSIVHLFGSDLALQVAGRHWGPAANGEYAGTNGSEGRMYYLHWLALGLPGGHGGKTHVDHINQDPRDSRRDNLRVVSNRVNHQNQRRQSRLGFCVYASARGFYQVRMRFANERTFHPAFRLLADAQRCRDVYLAIAQGVDAGLRSAPEKAELKAISDRLRTV